MLKNFLITGGAGFIGSHFIRHLFRNYPSYQINNLDILNYASNLHFLEEAALSDRYRFVKEDVCKTHNYYSLLGEVDCIVHFAAQTHVDRSFNVVDEFIHDNIEGTEKLLAAIHNLENIKRFVYISTDEVYGPIEQGYVDENAVFNPTNPYAKTKATADAAVQEFIKQTNVPAIIIRPSNNFGPNQHFEKFIPTVITKALNHFSVPVYGDGHYYREWIYVEDCVRAIDLIIHKGQPGEIYNVGSNNIWSNLDLAKKIIKLCDRSEGLIEFVRDRPVHDRRYAMDCRKLAKLGFEIKSDFEFCLLRTIDYYLDKISRG